MKREQSRIDRDFLLSCSSSLGNFDHPDIVLVQAPCWGVEMPPYCQAVLSAYCRREDYKILPIDLNVECYLRREGKYKEGWESAAAYWFWDTEEAASVYLEENRELFERFADIIVGTGTKMVGFTAYFCSLFLSLKLARILKERDSDIQIVLGGPHAARYLWPTRLLELGIVDLLVHGEGEITLVDLLARARAGESLVGTPGTSGVQGGEVVEGPPRPMIPKLDDTPFADFSDYVFDCYIDPDVLPMATSRGCINKCSFCSEIAFWPGYRALSGQRMFDEAVHQLELHPQIKEIAFQDSLINGHLREIENFGRLLIENGVELEWGGQAIMRKDLSYDLLERLKRAGCRRLAFGLESGSPEVLVGVGKLAMRGTDAGQVVRDAHAVGLKPSCNFMFGLPGETEADFQATLDFVRRNKDYLHYVSPSELFCIFTPGTTAYDHPEKFGIRDVETMLYWESHDGSNNWRERLRRFEVFLELVDDLGVPTRYPHRKLLNRERAIADYHYHRQDWERACQYYEAFLETSPDDVVVQNRLNECREKAQASGSAAVGVGPPATTNRDRPASRAAGA